MNAELEQRRAQILEQHRRMLVLFNAWMDKKKREVVTYRRENGDLVQHHPDGTEKVIKYAAK